MTQKPKPQIPSRSLKSNAPAEIGGEKAEQTFPKIKSPSLPEAPKGRLSRGQRGPGSSETARQEESAGPLRLVRYLALAGVASRRKAAKIIKNGQVTVNGETVLEPWVFVDPEKDTVTYRGKVIRPEKPVYILLNKPKNTICTVKDEKGRQTIMDLLEGAPPVRLYPVGRLDRNTTGILLLTNDGELAQKLLHPASKVPRTYRLTTVKPMTSKVVEKLTEGIPLSDGVAKADEAYLEDPYTLIITLHIGRKHIVKRMMEYLGYRVKALDRIAFGPITRKGVPRGKWRYLTPQEIGWLKMLPDPRKTAS
ncbi:MAG: rRNA pseudouridine synthase [Bacteroidia bacterium]|nr:rRNA pseudouridine synthase [Bacteroidia bacterium]